mmetsp:Transcript_34507/g.80650  ORF Transcript_34507/g.80650 Transcript_34507/m.80650 type:complete len:107 (+) Transcript_34507:463-783(+)
MITFGGLGWRWICFQTRLGDCTRSRAESSLLAEVAPTTRVVTGTALATTAAAAAAADAAFGGGGGSEPVCVVTTTRGDGIVGLRGEAGTSPAAEAEDTAALPAVGV